MLAQQPFLIEAESQRMIDAIIGDPDRLFHMIRNTVVYEDLGKRWFQNLMHTSSWLAE